MQSHDDGLSIPPAPAAADQSAEDGGGTGALDAAPAPQAGAPAADAAAPAAMNGAARPNRAALAAAMQGVSLAIDTHLTGLPVGDALQVLGGAAARFVSANATLPGRFQAAALLNAHMATMLGLLAVGDLAGAAIQAAEGVAEAANAPDPAAPPPPPDPVPEPVAPPTDQDVIAAYAATPTHH